MRFYLRVPFVALTAMIVTGCAGEFEAYPLSYSKSKLVTEIKDPEKQSAVVRALAELYGPTPREIKVPEGLDLRNGGIYLANYVINGEGDRKPIVFEGQRDVPIGGGYGLYRKHCLHCHGLSGDGAGPTADYLFPRPRDYRKGTFKFTSTTAGAKPSHNDLWRTINYGLHGTSMPGFEALMTPSEIEQVIDYVVFLSIRGETEILISQDVSDGAWDDEIKADGLKSTDSSATGWQKPASSSKIYPKALETAKMVAEKWTLAETQVMNTPKGRAASSNESILRGRELFWATRLSVWSAGDVMVYRRLATAKALLTNGYLQRSCSAATSSRRSIAMRIVPKPFSNLLPNVLVKLRTSGNLVLPRPDLDMATVVVMPVITRLWQAGWRH